MSKALLVGNGVTSQLIHNYNDAKMMDRLTKIKPALVSSINKNFDAVKSVCHDEQACKERIIQFFKDNQHNTTGTQIYTKYFEDYGLKYELTKKGLSNIEALLKVADLFKMSIQRELTEVANVIYFNDGLNGFDAIDISIDIDKEAFYSFINSFDMIFTTNYDYLMDDVYENEVFHLHGGFAYNKTRYERGTIEITRDRNVRKVSEPFLVWGVNGNEKLNSTKGGFSLPVTLPFKIGTSVINTYFDELKHGEYHEIHIWGYSGQNDKHINDTIKGNMSIKKVYYYCNPKTPLNYPDFEEQVRDMFISKEKNLILVSWDVIWKEAGVKETNCKR